MAEETNAAPPVKSNGVDVIYRPGEPLAWSLAVDGATIANVHTARMAGICAHALGLKENREVIEV